MSDFDFGGPPGSSSLHKKKNREKVNDTLTPLLISWLKIISRSHDGDIVKIDDVILDKVVICGRLFNIRSENTKTYIFLEDGSDWLRLVSNKKFDEDLPKILREVDTNRRNVYLKAIIDINFYQAETLYTPIKLVQLQNFNYVTYHFLNCLYSQKIRIHGFATGENGGRSDPEPHGHAPPRAADDDYTSDEYKVVLDKIRDIRRRTNSYVSLDDLRRELQGRLSVAVIRDALLFLHETSEVRKIPGSDTYDLL